MFSNHNLVSSKLVHPIKNGEGKKYLSFLRRILIFSSVHKSSLKMRHFKWIFNNFCSWFSIHGRCYVKGSRSSGIWTSLPFSASISKIRPSERHITLEVRRVEDCQMKDCQESSMSNDAESCLAETVDCRFRYIFADTVKHVEVGHLGAYCQTCWEGTTLRVLSNLLRRDILGQTEEEYILNTV